MNPIAPAQLDALVDRLDLPPGARVVDVGCGKGDLLRRIVARYDVEAVGVDVDPLLVADAPGGVAVVLADGREWARASGGFDLAASVGSVLTLTELTGLGRPGGLLLYGEGYWRREPSEAYLEALGATRDELPDVAAEAARLGLEVVAVELASTEDFDRYEDAWAANGRAYAAAHRGEPGVEAFAAWIESGRRRYRELGGRETLGFGIWLLRLPRTG
jgi:SAM-dependent methyltransferase